MNPERIITLQVQFDPLVQIHPEEAALEFWFARDLQAPLGYARWENFMTAIQRAIESCKTTGYEPEHHFRGVTKMAPPRKRGGAARRGLHAHPLRLLTFSISAS